MKILIKMPAANYDLLLGKLPKDSDAYAILKNGIVIKDSGDVRFIHIACEPAEAVLVLQNAEQLCPEIAHELGNEIRLQRPVSS